MKREVQNKQDTFIAAASIYQALFNRMTIPLGDHAIINFDELSHEVDYLREPGDEDLGFDEIRKKFNITELYNIVSTFEIVFLVGWKEHETLQKPLKPKIQNKEEFNFRKVNQFTLLKSYRYLD